MRYLITFSYLGTNYHGWQIQPNGNTVQEELNKALSVLCREEISTTGAGRTDTGVHARMMTAHFDVNNPIADGAQFVYRINKLLPKDISVSGIKEVDGEFSARFSATERTYRYYITKDKNPFTLDVVAYINFDLDIELMNKAASSLFEYEDFTSFSKVNTDTKTNICPCGMENGRGHPRLHNFREQISAQYGACDRRHVNRRGQKEDFGR